MHWAPAAFDSYRKEAERLLLWSTVELRKPLSSLTHEDLLAYQHFLADPQSAARWVMRGRKVTRAEPDCRPFAGPLAPGQPAASVRDFEYDLRVARECGVSGGQSAVAVAPAG